MSIKKIIILAVATTLAGAARGEPVHPAIRYACPASQEITVERDQLNAHVSLAGRTYDLQRKQSSIGAKYISRNAALILDGDSAVFIAEDRLDLGTCVRSVPIAEAH